MDLDSQPKVSWKQMLLEKGVSNQEKGSRSSKVECTESFQFLEGDVIKDYQWYSDNRVFGFGALYNQISSLWFPSKLFHLVDIENDYFLAELQCVEDYNTALLQRPYIINGQYLTVQPWTKSFNPKKPYPSMVLA
ncbi:hypothetical protein Godav_014805 [Gossypium davidsonii]|uniref:DUF4283 domain-containing protein n=1 Tax=Gossypium davidsonii TaxID=34287 RepID=A0A7J8RL06_GOSDV|nr:hypothetical protein [Gossypium davidsonii]